MVPLVLISAPGGQAAYGLIAFALVLVLALSAGLAWLLLVVRRRRLVIGASVAIKELDRLNQEFADRVAALSAIRADFRHEVTSKAKLERFDLVGFTQISLLDHEAWTLSEISKRLRAIDEFGTYAAGVDARARPLLGTSAHARIPEATFGEVESKLFESRRLLYPTPVAQVSATVTYRSPQGRNFYSRQLYWDFGQLRSGFQLALDTRSRQSTAAALRRRERSLMTPSLRMEILRRDQSRCQVCGASASDGATLHIDHITPISRGGKTTPTNLQTLCQTCNAGKSDKFVG